MPEARFMPVNSTLPRRPSRPPLGGDRHARAVANTLRMADQAASEADFGAALSWLAVIGAIGDELPGVYRSKRADWSARLAQRADQGHTLRTMLDTARETIGARYGALLIVDRPRQRVTHHLTAGIEPGPRRPDGLPGEGDRLVAQPLIAPSAPVRLMRAADHPARYGFPPGHPPMRSFLGVSVVIDGEGVGNLCLGEKESGWFTRADERALTGLALSVAATVAHTR